MFSKKTFQEILMKLGDNNKPTYVVMAVAVVKGIFRPLFTMMDKDEKPEVKKYTALRECLTEIIAIPAYYTCGELAGKLSKMIHPEYAAKKAEKNFLFIGVCLAALFVIPGLCSLLIKPIMDKLNFKAPDNSGNINNKFRYSYTNDNYVRENIIPKKLLNTYTHFKNLTARHNSGLRVE